MGILNDIKQAEDVFVISDYDEKSLDPGVSKPIKYPGYKMFIEDVNTDMSENSIGNRQIDSFRRDTFNFWSKTPNFFDETELFKLRNAPSVEYNESKLKVLKIYSGELNSYIYLQKMSEESEGATRGSLGERKRETYVAFLKPEDVASISNGQPNPNWWRDYLNKHFNSSGIEQYDLSDHNFIMDMPRNNPNADTGLMNNNFVHVKSNYNFLLGDYEAAISENEVDEKILPNLYTYMLVLEENNKILWSNLDVDNEKNELLNNFFNHVTLNNNLLGFDMNVVTNLVLLQETSLQTNTITEYFDSWTGAVQDFLEEENVGILQNYEKIVFSEASFEEIFKYNSSAKNFPMNVSISLSTDINKEFFNILKQTDSAQTIMYNSSTPEEDITTAVFVDTDGSTEFVGPARNLIDFEDLLEKAISGDLAKTDLPESYVYLGKLEDSQKSMLDGESKNIMSKLFGMSLKSKAKDLIEKHERKYENLLNGTPAYSETLFYEIEKWSSNSLGHLSELKQTFLLPNDDKAIIEFYDTQVKYNKYYVYRIYAHKIIVGTKYWTEVGPENLINDEAFSKSAFVFIHTAPSVKITKVPYYNVNETDFLGFFGSTLIAGGDFTPDGSPGTLAAPRHKTTIILDAPPIAPEVEFVPIIGKPNNIIINLKDTKGSVSLPSKTIGEEDAIQHDIIFKNQHSNRHNLTIEEIDDIDSIEREIFFKSDEPADFFEIFRIKRKPTSYSDFKENLMEVVDGPNGSTILKLNFNEKNYFTFRAIDNHGNYSNLTEIYEVELKENLGLSYPTIRVFNLEEETEKDFLKKQEETSPFSISGKRFVLIKPAHEQTEAVPPDEEGEEEVEQISAVDVKNFTLGIQEKSVFQANRKFKIRIKSKKTGRAIDINLQCKHKHGKILQ